MHFHDHGDDDDIEISAEEYTEDYVYSGDNIELTTVGIDIGSSTSHLLFSRLKLRRLGKHLSSRFVVVSREAIHRSPILLTPYKSDYTIDSDKLQRFVQGAYREADLRPDQVDTGAIILTGEAVKRSNARAIADLFATEAGKFVCVSAGHNLECAMAAHGSGAAARSRETGKVYLNVDVGGGTSKLALLKNGEILETAATAVGGRLIAFDPQGNINRIEPSAHMVADAVGVELHLGKPLSEADREKIAEKLADCLFAQMCRDQSDPLARELLVTPPLSNTTPIEVVTFSGGVSEFIYEREKRDFGDISAPLSRAIRKRMPSYPAPVEDSNEHIRATVIGASQFTVQVSGNTVQVSRPELLPMHNVQVLYPRIPSDDGLDSRTVADAISASFRRFDLEEGEQPVAITIDWGGTPSYQSLRTLADGIVAGLPQSLANGLPLVLVFQNDVGKLIGYILRDDLAVTNEVVSIDGVDVKEFDFIDIGAMIYPARAVPVVIKSLVFPQGHDPRAELAAT